MATTLSQRSDLCNQLSKLLDEWEAMTEDQLRVEFIAAYAFDPAAYTSKYMFKKHLILHHVTKML